MQKIITTLLVSAYMIGVSANLLFAETHAPPAPPKEAPTKDYAEIMKKLKVGPKETALFVGDMHCKTCAKKVAGKLYAVKGVMKVRTNVKEDVAIITPQQKKQPNVNDLWKAAQTAGFPPVKLFSPQGNYVPDPKTKAAMKLPDPKAVASKQG